ncbi:phospholipid-transporting ATPase Dnf1p [[Candida] railenensis]|uniref:Phospholipid-transporting ATPase n=1 Tax=[Candida] railenensis TaxID=45579 RepID=A0A9P0VX67_9ASCO|nr:phospholipid-transporting ATPase Dnf1p [[Candida] railenensis]
MSHDKSPFSDQNHFSVSEIADQTTSTADDSTQYYQNNHSVEDHHPSTSQGSRQPASPADQSFNSYTEASDNESFASALPTPNLNVDSKRFDFKPVGNGHKPNALRFQMPEANNGHNDSQPITSNSSSTRISSSGSITKSKISSPFMDSNTIVEDQEYGFSKPQSPFIEMEEDQQQQVRFGGIQDDLDESIIGEDEETMQRHRWGTTRNKKGRPKKENINRSKTLKGLLHSGGSKRKGTASSSANASRNNSIRKPKTNTSSDDDDDDEEEKIEEEIREANDKRHEKRVVVLNRTLPEEFLNPETGLPATVYARNKIRTTKYTPLSFLPKNIFNQFYHNIANIYFLAMIILGFFSIFGVPSPVLSAVPLICIVIITAIKDAIEDSRRTISDMEVNNQYTHILVNNNEYVEDGNGDGINTRSVGRYENNNVYDEKISLWRKFKKWNTKLLFKFIESVKRNLTKEGRAKKLRESNNAHIDNAVNRNSFDSTIERTTTRNSQNPFDNRKSMQSRRSLNLRKSIGGKKELKFARKFWKDVSVGDVVRLYNNDEIPADVVILSTSDDDNCCYVETKNLDGETNLKVRQALKYGSNIKRADDILNHDFEINSEGPHANLYSYQANLSYKEEQKPGADSSSDEDSSNSQEPITINNILLRGCFLRNTKWVIGIVVFTGDDTKIMINAGVTPTKQSRISRELNHYVFLNFILVFIICFISGLVNGIYYTKNPSSRDYFEFGTIAGAPWKNGLLGFFVALILYQSLIPISLYITIEIIKTAQAFFIFSDVGMYYERLDFPCTPKSWSISDDLGQIEYIFSDKTGTLTQNVMEFKKCTINGISYGKAYTEALAGLRKRQGIDVEAESVRERALIVKDQAEMIEKLNNIHNNTLYDDELTFVSSEFVDHLTGSAGLEQKDSNEHFMLCLALCHSVVTEVDPKNDAKLQLKAQSPDEAALVGTARAVGFEFSGSTKKGLILNIQGEQREYQVLNTLEFNSTRKRMSSIIKIPAREGSGDEPTALLICKGADSIIYDRLSKTKNDKTLLEVTAKHLEEYATEGLRTLCIAQRELKWSQYVEWNRRHQEAAASLDNREEKMEAVADSVERELILLGGTAIEDRLQDGVPDCIALLAQAGIKLWVLTGDKVETAINIGFSCNLLGNDMELLILKTSLEENERQKYGLPNSKLSEGETVDLLITKYLSLYFKMEGSLEEIDAAIKDHSPPEDGFGLVIDGDALKVALLDPDTKRKFLLLCKQCKAVLCCRVSPAQKAAVVKLVKDTLDVMTLAIGDGSNDVAMIQAADVGVGIAGEEGRQAVMSSDFAIGQFRFLAKLLLAHGRWSYKRFSEMIPCFFYKNVIFPLALFWYGVYCDCDGTYMFEFTYLTFYNLAFTSLPVIVLGILDQDVDGVVSLLVPQLYRSGILRSEWTDTKFWIYSADGLYQSVISFFFPYLMYRSGFTGMNGLPIDHRFWMGVIVVCISCISCNLYILFHQLRWDWFSSLITAISILIIYFWTIVWSSVLTSAEEFYNCGVQLFQNGPFWACTAIGIIACLFPRFMFDFIQKMYWPKDVDIVRECVARGDFDVYPRLYDPTDPNRAKISKYSSDTVARMSSSKEYKKSVTNSMDSMTLRSNAQSPIPQGQSSAINEPRRQSTVGFSSEAVIGGPEFQNDLPNETIINRKHHHGHTTGKKSVSSTKRKSVLDIFKRQSNVKSYYDNGSLIDGYNFSNETQDDLSKVQTEEIPLDEFDFAHNQQRMSRISNENKRISYDGQLQRIRTSLELPEMVTTESLVSRVTEAPSEKDEGK